MNASLIGFLSALVTLTGCGHQDVPAGAPVQATTVPVITNNGFNGSRCGETVTNAYSEISIRCRSTQIREEVQRCKELAEDFLRNFPNVSCISTIRDERNGQARDLKIEDREIQEILDRLRRFG